MEKVTRSFKNLYHGIAIPNQLEIHSTARIIALSGELASESNGNRYGHGRWLQTRGN